MQVEVLYTPGCATEHAAPELVRSVLAKLGLPPDVETIPVASPEEAVRLEFPGSPTIRVNGRDVDPAAGRAFGLG